MNRKLTGLTFAGITAALVIGAFALLNRLVIGRASQIAQTAQALAAGQNLARTRMQATDELGAAGLPMNLVRQGWRWINTPTTLSSESIPCT